MLLPTTSLYAKTHTHTHGQPRTKYEAYIKVNIGMMGCFRAQMNLCSFILGFGRRVEACAITSTWNIYYYSSFWMVFSFCFFGSEQHVFMAVRKTDDAKIEGLRASFWHETMVMNVRYRQTRKRNQNSKNSQQICNGRISSIFVSVLKSFQMFHCCILPGPSPSPSLQILSWWLCTVFGHLLTFGDIKKNRCRFFRPRSYLCTKPIHNKLVKSNPVNDSMGIHLMFAYCLQFYLWN